MVRIGDRFNGEGYLRDDLSKSALEVREEVSNEATDIDGYYTKEWNQVGENA
jgi:hypothetical protein